MRRPSYAVVMLVVCASATLRTCVAVRLIELLQRLELEQNPDSTETGDDEVLADQSLFIVNTTTTPPQEPHTNNRVHLDHIFTDHHEFGSGAGGYLRTTTEASAPTTTITAATTTTMLTDVPTTARRLTTCCRLGEMAGRRKDHCNPENYMPTHRRDRNHNFKTNKHPSRQRSQIDKCVSGVIARHAEDFHMCCREAYKRMWATEHGEVDNGDTHLVDIVEVQRPLHEMPRPINGMPRPI